MTAATAAMKSQTLSVTYDLKLKQSATENPSEYARSVFADKKRARPIYCSNSIVDRQTAKQEFYTNESVRAIRNNDIDALREMLVDGKSFDARNSNGETLLHLACRRSNIETIKFLVSEARVPVNVSDNMGRTPLHDICWRPKPDVVLMKFLSHVVSPDTLLAVDLRGHCCFDYCRKSDWAIWVKFLDENRESLLVRSALYDSFLSTA